MIGFFKKKRPDVIFYNDIKTTPIHRYMELQKMILRETGLGCTISDYNRRNSDLIEYLKVRDVDKAMQEMQSHFNTWYNIINNININSMVLAPCIKEVRGKLYEGTELEEHREVLNDLANDGLTIGDCEEAINFIKKNSILNLNATFLITHTAQRAKMRQY